MEVQLETKTDLLNIAKSTADDLKLEEKEIRIRGLLCRIHI